jgi:N-glycosylase/DNA lyase
MDYGLIEGIKKLKKTKTKKLVEKRLRQFESLGKKDTRQWFSELCFCILTANSKAHTAIKIQNELGAEGFCKKSKNGVRRCIIAHKHRFHNNKTAYILGAREHIDIKKKLKGIDSKKAREWLIKNVKGIGYKEASHFLRNVGYFDLAILDRHILNLMAEDGIIKKPKSLARKNYLIIERKFIKIAEKLKMSPAELDLYMWSLKTGEVLK